MSGWVDTSLAPHAPFSVPGPTGIPYGTVNLRKGVPKGETSESSLAGAGSLSLEFSVLSALSNDGRFAKVIALAASGLGVRGGEERKRFSLLSRQGAGGHHWLRAHHYLRHFFCVW